MKYTITIVVIIFTVISLIAIAFTINQVNQETIRLTADLHYRSSLLANGLRETVEPNFINKSQEYLQGLVNKYTDNQRIAGLAVVDNKGEISALSPSLPKDMLPMQQITNSMDENESSGEFVNLEDQKMYVFSEPLKDESSVVGALVVVQNASYIDDRLFSILTRNALRIITQTLLISIAVLLILQWLVYRPIQKFIDSLKATKNGSLENGTRPPSNPLFKPLFKEFERIQGSLVRARMSASEEARAGLEKSNLPWTSERLQEFIKDIAKGRQIFLASNREPYIHTKNGNSINYYSPASGMVTALEPVMSSCRGTWIAHGSGEADKEVVNDKDIVMVPPADPRYKLKRVWLTQKEEDGYYNGFSNEGIWPLCHQAFNRPIFRKEDWEEYKAVNKKFAQSVLSEMKNVHRPIVFIQDFHLALVPQMIKSKRPDATIGIFWHIPWPSPESFSICPWKKELLNGILGADIVGFHTQLHCNNFIETVRHEVESLVSLEKFSVTRNNHTSYVKSFPISIDFTVYDTTLDDDEKENILKSFSIKTPFIGLGIDRLDYTKGILERLKAIEIFLDKNPSYRGKFTFLQISVPSRTKVKRYQEFRNEVEKEVERINSLYRKNGWKPIILSLKQYSHTEVNKLYKIANFCMVTSLDDGMNLVAKEFIASRKDELGSLILSEFTGASRQLTNSLLVNPYNAEQSANVIKKALEMSIPEQNRRMRAMREEIKTYNIYLWSAEIIKALVNLG